MTTHFRYDNAGKQIGLDWTVYTPPKKKLKRSTGANGKTTATVTAKVKSKTGPKPTVYPAPTGRQREDLCPAGLHDMNEHGREIKAGGRYCNACKNIRQRKWNKKNRPSRAKVGT